ncbi:MULTISPECIES: hypothetical protein [unclassified Variovorax]|uniref:hypothetical protein n=1 Tax=unclassified Variovorax TaxID=663243 RepID=UPI00076CAB00|nr:MULTISPECIES: hypothetical protein [unclassified Variovorax]KWT83882.1 hypothetical protein APY03_4437 [Variovorax sp. WDL1]PNG46564.1 hypothetical protein CHC06_06907 [Variovorax sp. B2]PNG47614.1 hypothetical protein CHC07_06780 [Variovorax sp. B4]VTV14332.1 hypothetical protein WDL1CHR_04880 [Variovorax sp. WDL1]
MAEFFDNKPAIEAHLLDIERELTQPIKATPARLRDRILAKAAVFLADCIGKRALELHNDVSRRVAMLEQRRPPAFLAVWEEGRHYGAQAFVTYGGRLWHATADTKAVPGTNGDWTPLVG